MELHETMIVNSVMKYVARMLLLVVFVFVFAHTSDSVFPICVLKRLARHVQRRTI